LNNFFKRELSEDESDPATLSEVRQMSAQYGVPTADLVGQRVAEDYAVLAAHDQPVAFLQQVLAVLQRIAGSGAYR
jgi:hypothetical protein